MSSFPAIKGTGYLLQDLISSSIPLKRIKLSPSSKNGWEYEDNNSSSLYFHNNLQTDSNLKCLICSENDLQVCPLSQKEKNVLFGLILKIDPEQLPSGSCICSGCSRMLAYLEKIQKEIENIIQVVKTLVKLPKGKFFVEICVKLG
jgi:hypothetical protein